MPLKRPELIEEVTAWRGLRFNVVRRTYRKEIGKTFSRDVVVFPHAVVVLPFINENTVLLIRQFRAPLGDFIIEAPAGVIDEGESPEETATRELIEEIGYEPRKLVKMGSFAPAPGYSTEILHFFYAEDLVPTGPRPEEYEIIEPYPLSFNEAVKMVLDNRLRDMKTALALLLYLELSRRGSA